MGMSSWVPPHTQGLFPTCCRWYCIPWVLLELLLSNRGRVRPRARLFDVVLSMMLLLDLITNWHVFEQVCVMLVLKLYCFRYCSWTWYCNNYIWTPMYVEVLVNLCNMWLVCWIMYDIGCMLDFQDPSWYSTDYRVYMGSSMTVRSLRWLPLYLCSYKLVGSAIATLVASPTPSVTLRPTQVTSRYKCKTSYAESSIGLHVAAQS